MRLYEEPDESRWKNLCRFVGPGVGMSQGEWNAQLGQHKQDKSALFIISPAQKVLDAGIRIR